MRIATDVLIVGAGIQGLALLDALREHYSVVLVGDSAALSETRHWHGYFSSGWNAADRRAAGIYRQAAATWAQRLQGNGIDPHESDFHAVVPPAVMTRLRPNWDAVGLDYEEAACPPPFHPTSLPPHRVLRFPEDLIFDASAALDECHDRHQERILAGQVHGFVLEGARVVGVKVDAGGQELVIAPSHVLIACGAGNAAMLQRLGAAPATIARSQLVRPMHILCVRGRDLPRVSAFLIDLVVISHPLEDGETNWLVTYNPPEPAFTAGAIDMAVDPPVSRAVLEASIARLARLLPDFVERAEACQWDVYVGWKTDAPGPDPKPLLELSYPQPYHLSTAGLDNVHLVWPNHWGLATAAAETAANQVRQHCRSRHAQPDLPETRPSPAPMKWRRDDRHWRSWPAFAACYDLPQSP